MSRRELLPGDKHVFNDIAGRQVQTPSDKAEGPSAFAHSTQRCCREFLFYRTVIQSTRDGPVPPEAVSPWLLMSDHRRVGAEEGAPGKD